MTPTTTRYGNEPPRPDKSRKAQTYAQYLLALGSHSRDTADDGGGAGGDYKRIKKRLSIAQPQ